MSDRYYLPTNLLLPTPGLSHRNEGHSFDKSLARLVERARRRNVTRDLQDNSAGYAAPGDSGHAAHLRTAISAIASGLSTCSGIDENSANCIAEGIAMIQEVELELRKAQRLDSD